MIIQILFQQNFYSRILDAGNDFSSQQCFQVEGFDIIPILPSPDSRALLVGAELPLESPVDVGAKAGLGHPRAKDRRGNILEIHLLLDAIPSQIIFQL